MGIEKVKLNCKRVFSEDFKKSRVKEYEKGTHTVSELGKLFDIHPKVIYRWIYKYSLYNKKSYKIVEMSKSSTQKVKDLEKRIQELERIVGQKQLNIDYLEKLIEIADDELGIDIKKKQDTPQSSGSGKTKEK